MCHSQPDKSLKDISLSFHPQFITDRPLKRKLADGLSAIRRWIDACYDAPRTPATDAFCCETADH
jgi:hypothetical protein